MEIFRKIRLILFLGLIAGCSVSSLTAMQNLLTQNQVSFFASKMSLPDCLYTSEEIARLSDNFYKEAGNWEEARETIDAFFDLFSEQLFLCEWSEELEGEVKTLFDADQQQELGSKFPALSTNILKSSKCLNKQGWASELSELFLKIFKNDQCSDLFFKKLSSRFDDCSWQSLAIFNSILLQANSYDSYVFNIIQRFSYDYCFRKKAELDERYSELENKNMLNQSYMFIYILSKMHGLVVSK